MAWCFCIQLLQLPGRENHNLNAEIDQLIVSAELLSPSQMYFAFHSFHIYLNRCVSLLDKATKAGASAINPAYVFFNLERASGSMLPYFCVPTLSSKTSSQLWEMTIYTKLDSFGGLFLLKGSFPFHYCHMIRMKDCWKFNNSMQSTVHCYHNTHVGGGRNATN